MKILLVQKDFKDLGESSNHYQSAETAQLQFLTVGWGLNSPCLVVVHGGNYSIPFIYQTNIFRGKRCKIRSLLLLLLFIAIFKSI